MKAADVVIGEVYTARVSGKRVEVRVIQEAQPERSRPGVPRWYAQNLTTKRRSVITVAASRLRALARPRSKVTADEAFAAYAADAEPPSIHQTAPVEVPRPACETWIETRPHYIGDTRHRWACACGDHGAWTSEAAAKHGVEAHVTGRNE